MQREALKKVNEAVDKSEGTEITVETIQDLVEKALMEVGLHEVAKSYILYRKERNDVREMDTTLMHTLKELTFSSAEEADLKRENGNIDGNSAMGTMLRYGSEAAKAFVDKFVLEPDMAFAHADGLIHIHDKDFYMLTMTCVGEDTEILVRYDRLDYAQKITMKAFESMTKKLDIPSKVLEMSVMSGNEWVPLKSVVRHAGDEHIVFELDFSNNVSLTVTEEHIMYVKKRGETEFTDIEAKYINVGDVVQFYNDKIDTLEEVEVTYKCAVRYNKSVYDIETGNHYFNANGIKVHNCCQIDLDKLLEGGFSTGHGVLREPNGIGAYAALAAIAIQANQNDQHGGQAVPNFDYALGKGVAKTFVKEFMKYARIRLELYSDEGYDFDDCIDTTEEILYRVKSILMEYVQSKGRVMSSEGLAIARENLKNEFGAEKGNQIFEFASRNATDETDRATYQAMEGLVHNLNTMNSRAGRSTAMVEVPVTWETLCPAV